MRLRLFIFAIIFCVVRCLSQSANDINISFVNFYPGSDIYELEGHSVLRIQTPSNDFVVSYGTFDFDAPNFVYRFVKGETDYWASVAPWQPFADIYIRQNRRIVEHPLRLDSIQKIKLLQLAENNLLPQNRTYRYNYVKDNCALRPLRLVQKAIGDSIIISQPNKLSLNDVTFRDVMRYYHRNYPWYQFGIDLALGSGIDYPLTAWEKAFAPVLLAEQLTSSLILDSKTGTLSPLTYDPIVVYEGADATLAPTPWYLTPMAVSIFLLIIVIAFTIRDVRRKKVTKWLDAILFGIFGLLGLLLTFLIFVSVHEATSPNYLYLWLNPLCLIVPIFIWLKKCNIVVLSYQIVNFALLLCMAIVWPICGQSGNIAFLPLIVCDATRSFNYIYVSYKNKKLNQNKKAK